MPDGANTAAFMIAKILLGLHADESFRVLPHPLAFNFCANLQLCATPVSHLATVIAAKAAAAAQLQRSHPMGPNTIQTQLSL